MNASQRKHYTVCFAFLVLLLGLFLAVNLLTGSTAIPPREVLGALFGTGGSDTVRSIVRNIRLPRLLSALILGGALSVAGFQLQTFFANPIAGPFVLGISSGSKLVVALVMIACLRFGRAVSSGMLIGAAFLGAMLCMGIILLAAGRVRNMAVLIVCGVMIGYICTAITDILVTFADDSNIVNLHNWSMGSFSGIGCFGISARRGLCPQHGGGDPPVSRCPHPALQPALRMRHGLFRADLFCGSRRSSPDEEPVPHGKAACHDPRVLSRGRGVLPLLRSCGPHALCTC